MKDADIERIQHALNLAMDRLHDEVLRRVYAAMNKDRNAFVTVDFCAGDFCVSCEVAS